MQFGTDTDNLKACQLGKPIKIVSRNEGRGKITLADAQAVGGTVEPLQVRIVENNNQPRRPGQLRSQVQEQALNIEVMVQCPVNQNRGSLI
jgi:hypothetical protein